MITKDLSQVTWTYAHALSKDFSNDNIIKTAYDNKSSVHDLKQVILEVCKDCARTPAYNKFVSRINSFRDTTSMIFFVYNSFLKGSGFGSIN